MDSRMESGLYFDTVQSHEEKIASNLDTVQSHGEKIALNPDAVKFRGEGYDDVCPPFKNSPPFRVRHVGDEGLLE